jgi:hypothetical protein
MGYSGPLRDEPLAVELHNTIYATNAGAVDGLADPASVRAWLAALEPRLRASALRPGRLPAAEAGGPSPRSAGLPAGPWPSAGELVALRDAVRPALQAAAEGRRPARNALDALNAASRRAPCAPIAVWHPGKPPSPGTDVAGASRADLVLATIAADAIDLLTGVHRDDLRTCGAPRCVLMFLKDHPRREWCCDRCGNRARQARHYERHVRH